MRFAANQSGAGIIPVLDYANAPAQQTMDAAVKTFALPAGCTGALIVNTGAVFVFYRTDGVAVGTSGGLRVPLATLQSALVSVKPVLGVSSVSVVGASGDVYVMPVKSQH